ncbi:MAG TPA: substrate-binding domain-containing protein [Gaiellaceae bacterium]|jgi:ABC-type sugar transport system, periplasmic component|nr:substrate-binding domain-containing protein [Gaiellaceae bacterium]
MTSKTVAAQRSRPRVRRRVVLAALLVAVAVGAVSAAAATFASPTPAQEIASSGIVNVPFCGTKPITLAVLDGYGVNAWSQHSYAAVRSEAAKCTNVTVTVAAGGGDLQKSIADISGAVAQGANAIVVIPDFGQSELPAIQQATKAGVKVVPWAASAGGTNGTDYVSYVDWLPQYAGTIWAQWMAGVLHGKGNVAYLGGPAGNPVGMDALANMVKVFKKYPGIKLITGNTGFAVTNWDPATAQKVTAALLAKYPKIDGIITNYGTDALAAARAFQAAGRKLVPVAGADANGLSCLYKKSGTALATVSTRNWLGRIAARKAIAAAEGLPNTEPSLLKLGWWENTTAGKPAKCVAGAPSDYYPSDKISLAQLKQYGTP